MCGNIGVGKSTLIKNLKACPDFPVLTMSEDALDYHPYFDNFKMNKARGNLVNGTALELELCAYLTFCDRVNFAKEQNRSKSEGILITERSQFDVAFVFVPHMVNEGWLSENQAELLVRLCEVHFVMPDVMIMLDDAPLISHDRLKAREAGDRWDEDLYSVRRLSQLQHDHYAGALFYAKLHSTTRNEIPEIYIFNVNGLTPEQVVMQFKIFINRNVYWVDKKYDLPMDLSRFVHIKTLMTIAAQEDLGTPTVEVD